MKSVSVVEWKDDTLTEQARHFQTAWATAVGLVDEHTFLEADAEGNLMVLSQDISSEFAEDRRRLKITSEMLLGEMVNRIKPITLTTPANAATAIVIPKAFLATVEGSIYLFGIITPAHQNMLMELQRAIAKVVPGLGEVPFMKYRAFKSQVREEEEPMRFVDGEMVERFLDVGDAVQGEIVTEMRSGGVMSADAEEIRGVVERLRRLR
jgi:DNA damage-binding protein 1